MYFVFHFWLQDAARKVL